MKIYKDDKGMLITTENKEDEDKLKDMFVKDGKFKCAGCEQILPISERRESIMGLNFCKNC